MENNINLLIMLLFLMMIISFQNVSSYECYVCENQENNQEKCIKTIKTCGLDDNSCMTVVRWGSTPYWDPTGQKQYYISKRCSTLDDCYRAKENVSRRCDRIWYNDWECVECCTGDRCNYFITLGVSTITANSLTQFISISFAIIMAFLLKP